MKPLNYDIVIAGGGTAGTAAAIAAGRRGHRVLLVEEQNCLGGTSTTGGVCWWFASLEGLGDIFDSVKKRMARHGALFSNPGHFNPEYLKFVWQQLAEEANVDVLFHASVCNALREGDRLKSVEILSCSATIFVKAGYFIDATGEGDLAALAGADFMKGDPESGLLLHMTLTAWMYDTGVPVVPYLPDGVRPLNGESDLPGLGGGYVVDRRRVFLNATKIIRHDPTDPFSLSDAERAARRQLFQIVHLMQRTRFPTYELGGTGSKIGIREGRRVIGDYILARDDIMERPGPTRFDDGVAVATCQIDFHSLAKYGSSGLRQAVHPYNIPIRSLIVRGFDNLLVAGKCISADQIVHSSCRMTPTCCAMGQAVGTAAAVGIELDRDDIRDVPVPELQTLLSNDGMELDPNHHRSFCTSVSQFDDDDILPGTNLREQPFGGRVTATLTVDD